jgi:hypothetical protein
MWARLWTNRAVDGNQTLPPTSTHCVWIIYNDPNKSTTIVVLFEDGGLMHRNLSVHDHY